MLYAKERSIQDLQFQTLYWDYVKNKYDRKVYKIFSQFYDLMKIGKIKNGKERLFVINKSSGNYRPIIFIKEKQILEAFFPNKTKYELDEIKTKGKMISSQNENLINSLLIEKINEKINMNYLKNKVVSNVNDLFKKIKNPAYEDNNLKKILKEEIEYMREQCRWQEIINFIFAILFMLLLIYRYSNIKNINNDN